MNGMYFAKQIHNYNITGVINVKFSKLLKGIIKNLSSQKSLIEIEQSWTSQRQSLQTWLFYWELLRDKGSIIKFSEMYELTNCASYQKIPY